MYGRYGYRRIWGLLCLQGREVSLGRVKRSWRCEGLKVPSRQPKRARLWLNDGSCIRLRPSWKNPVWSYDFVEDRTNDRQRRSSVRNATAGIPAEGRQAVSDACRARRVQSRVSGDRRRPTPPQRRCHGLPGGSLCPAWRARSHPVPLSSIAAQSTVGQGSNGPEFVAKAVLGWLDRLDVKPLYIEPGSPWENGGCESFNGKRRDELLAREICYRLKEARILIERW